MADRLSYAIERILKPVAFRLSGQAAVGGPRACYFAYPRDYSR